MGRACRRCAPSRGRGDRRGRSPSRPARQARDDEQDRGPQIGRHHLRAAQAGHAGDEHGIALEVALEVDAGSEPRQLLHVHGSRARIASARQRAAYKRHRRGSAGMVVSRQTIPVRIQFFERCAVPRRPPPRLFIYRLVSLHRDRVRNPS